MPVLVDSKSTIDSDPIRNFKFHVNILHTPPGSGNANKSLARLGFMNMSGLAITTDPIPYREGGNNTTQRKMPGQTSFSDITLSRGLALGQWQSWYWMLELFSANQGQGNAPVGNNFRTTIDISVFAHPVTAGNTPAYVKYRVYNAWISGLAYSELDAGGNAVFVEQMTLTHEGFRMFLASGVGDDVYNQS